MRKTAYIGLGSNLGDPLRLVDNAWQALGRLPGIVLGPRSHPYRSEPVGMASPNWFINAVGKVWTSLAPAELLAQLLALEQSFGRQRYRNGEGYCDRTLDLDLLLYDSLVLTGPDLVVPHPELHRRLFVMMPLCEIDPELRHPILVQTMRQLLQALLLEENPQCCMTEWIQG